MVKLTDKVRKRSRERVLKDEGVIEADITLPSEIEAKLRDRYKGYNSPADLALADEYRNCRSPSELA
jgi:hypothetical protein